LGQWGRSYRDREPLNSVIGKHGPLQANAFRLQSTASTSKLPNLHLLGVLEGIQATNPGHDWALVIVDQRVFEELSCK
jgi:hypothetical protein